VKRSTTVVAGGHGTPGEGGVGDVDQGVDDGDDLNTLVFSRITDQLDQSIKRERRVAALFGLVALVGSAVGLWVLYHSALSGVKTIRSVGATDDESDALIAVTIYLVVRGTAFAGVVAGLLYAAVSLARSALDQATRFDKRLVAARFIDYAVHAETVDVAKMNLAMSVLEAWSKSVDSAYTLRGSTKRSDEFSASAGKDGVSLAQKQATEGDSV